MYLGQLLKSVSKVYQKTYVHGISFDSRKVKKGDIFFAIRGKNTSGTKFIDSAIFKGASVIISDKINKHHNYKVPVILVKDVRKSLSEACSKFYKNKPTNIIAVTGTNGKSSVVNFYYQILNLNNISAASVGTLGIYSKKYKKKTNLTSMDPLELHKSLAILAKNKVKNVMLEASSHGLEQKRLDNLKISGGIFTNLSHDHLDYHKNMQAYLNSKMHLFKNLIKKNSRIILDEDIKEFKNISKIAKIKKLKKITIGSNFGDLKILSNKYKKNKQIIKISTNLKNYNLIIPLIGYFQIKNLLMAVLAASLCGIKKEKIFKQLHRIKAVPGRLECIATFKNNSNVIVDFAHTPDALEQTLNALKKQFKTEIVIVFGCGGDRDKKKRYYMGKIAKKYCRKVFVTDDNPRGENPKTIRSSIIRGCKNIAVDIGNRKKAIKTAINELGSNEILLVAGKGHESKQDYGNKIINFSDKKYIREIIFKKKYKKKEKYNNPFVKKVFKNQSFKIQYYNGVSINTKKIKKNNLFFAIKGKNTDGHKYVKEAFRKGASGLVVSKKIKIFPKNKIIKVKNTLSSLNNLAKVTRNNSFAEIIGITGSVGKTTLKNLISFSLKNYGNVHHSPHSYNNKYGVPLSLSNLKNNTDYGVFEIGMDKKGEIDNLSKMVRPKTAIITNISAAHLKNFNSLLGIAKAKSEIINNIIEDGTIILNKDDKFFNFLSRKAKKRKINIISFSVKKKSDIYLMNIKKVKKNFRLKINVKNKIFNFDTKHSTNNIICNVLACISTMFVLNLDLNKMEKKFIDFKIPEGRGDIAVVKKFNKKFKFIDESYNANPLSMVSAINNMDHYKIAPYQRKFIFLSDMLELGKKSEKFHKDLSLIINKSKINKVFVYGKHIKKTFDYLSASKKGKIFKNINEAHSYFAKILHNNDLLMVKGSNATGLNKFSENIKKGQINAI